MAALNWRALVIRGRYEAKDILPLCLRGTAGRLRGGAQVKTSRVMEEKAGSTKIAAARRPDGHDELGGYAAAHAGAATGSTGRIGSAGFQPHFR
jgi:hypothetical protein